MYEYVERYLYFLSYVYVVLAEFSTAQPELYLYLLLILIFVVLGSPYYYYSCYFVLLFILLSIFLGIIAALELLSLK
jgi:hypothetical protein